MRGTVRHPKGGQLSNDPFKFDGGMARRQPFEPPQSAKEYGGRGLQTLPSDFVDDLPVLVQATNAVRKAIGSTPILLACRKHIT